MVTSVGHTRTFDANTVAMSEIEKIITDLAAYGHAVAVLIDEIHIDYFVV